MDSRHDPDPTFVTNLEWQLATEVRRGRRVGGTQGRSVRALKIAGLMLGSVALGAAGMGASQQLGDAWRRELLEARLDVQLELARQRVQMLLETVELTREQVEQGLRDDRDLLYLELQIAQADADRKVMELDLEEVESTGREPLGELSSPLVDGRDFVSEKVEARMEVARLHLDIVRREEDRTRQLADAGMIDQGEVQARNLVAMEAALQLEAMTKQLELRRAYLDSGISAVEAELRLLEVEAENRVALLKRQMEYYQLELDRFQEAVGSAVALSHMRARVAEVEGQLRLAQAELEIVRRELERRASGR